MPKKSLQNDLDFSIKEARKTQKTFRILAVATIALIGFGVCFYHFFEKWTWVDSLYFCVVSLTTVGYGDITPQSDGAKLFTILYLLVGIGIIAAFVGTFFKAAIARREIKIHEHDQD